MSTSEHDFCIGDLCSYDGNGFGKGTKILVVVHKIIVLKDHALTSPKQDPFVVYMCTRLDNQELIPCARRKLTLLS